MKGILLAIFPYMCDDFAILAKDKLQKLQTSIQTVIHTSVNKMNSCTYNPVVLIVNS